MSELIEGLHVDVPGTEMKELLEGRLHYHQEKVGFYEKQLESMRAVDAAMEEEAERIGKTSNAGPAASLQQTVKKHRDQAVYFAFMAKHIVTTATYRLDSEALVRLGVQSDRFY